jgi:hypothetical protein
LLFFVASLLSVVKPGGEPVVLIEFDFEGDTVHRLGMPDAHVHP